MPTRYINAVHGLPFLSFHPSSTTSLSDSTLALDSAYTYASAGDAVFYYFVASETGNLTDVWFRVTSYSGTWESTDGVINVEIREDTNGNNIPGTTLTGSFTVTLDGTTTGWIKKTGLSIALTAGKNYCIVFGDADGTASNYVTLAMRTGNTQRDSLYRQIVGSSISTTNGFLTNGANSSGCPIIVLKIAGELYSGGGYTSIATLTSNAVERGNRFQAPDNCVVAGWCLPADTGFTGSTVKLYADGTAPGGSTLASFTIPARIGSGTTPSTYSTFWPAANNYNLTAGTWYRFVLDPLASMTTPRKAIVGGSPDADVLAAVLPLGGNCYYTYESGGNWVDETNAVLMISPLLLLNTDSGGGGARSYTSGG